MEKAKEAATETESESKRRLRLEHQRRVVELEFLKRSTEFLILVCLDRIKTRKDHRLHLLKSGNRIRTWIRHMSDGITDLDLAGCLDTRNDISYTSARDFLARMHLHFQYTDLICDILLACADELHLVSRLDRTVHNLEICDDSTE